MPLLRWIQNGKDMSSDRPMFSQLCRFVDEPTVSYGVWDPCINAQPDVGDDYIRPIRWLVPQYRNGTNVFVPSDTSLRSAVSRVME